MGHSASRRSRAGVEPAPRYESAETDVARHGRSAKQTCRARVEPTRRKRVAATLAGLGGRLNCFGRRWARLNYASRVYSRVPRTFTSAAIPASQSLLLIGAQLAEGAYGGAFLDVWLMHVMPEAIIWSMASFLELSPSSWTFYEACHGGQEPRAEVEDTAAAEAVVVMEVEEVAAEAREPHVEESAAAKEAAAILAAMAESAVSSVVERAVHRAIC